MVKRLLDPLKNSSLFIFGARGTGKSTFVKSQLISAKSMVIDFLNPEIENKYAAAPQRLKQEILARTKKIDWVVIDEVQKVPKILDVVHSLIEEKKIKFILTGSSARKLKRGSANLLAGRAYVYNLYPFCFLETQKTFDLNQALQWGMLPTIFSLKSNREKMAYLNSYVLTYLNEEIRAEQLVRKLDPFRAFLPILGQVAGKIINHKKIADEINVTTATIQSYFQIVEDTLLGFYVPAFHLSVRKSQRQNPKFYLFDVGVKKALEESLEQGPAPRTSVYSELFEHFMINEIVKLSSYFEKNFRISYYATKNAVEIDLVLSKRNQHYLIEIKSKDRIDEKEVNSLSSIAKDFPAVKGVFYLSRDPSRAKIADVNCVHWADFLRDFEHM